MSVAGDLGGRRHLPQLVARPLQVLDRGRLEHAAPQAQVVEHALDLGVRALQEGRQLREPPGAVVGLHEQVAQVVRRRHRGPAGGPGGAASSARNSVSTRRREVAVS
jgi:hypothetical protein